MNRFLGLLASRRDLFRVGQDLAANTGNLSPLTAAALCYLAITVPLTHFVNRIDRRLRQPESSGGPLLRVLGLTHGRTGG